jgi:nucleotide-binding universal stress UspA family protein
MHRPNASQRNMAALPKKILLPTDGLEEAALAARTAVDLAERSGAELHLVHAWTDVPTARLEAYVTTQLEQEGRRVLDEEAQRIEDAGGTLMQTHLREGRTEEEIVDLAKELRADLVVVGSRGLGPVKCLAVGSAYEGVVKLTPCPVLVMRNGEKETWSPERIVIGEDSSQEAKRSSELAASIGRLFAAQAILVQAQPPLKLTGAGGPRDPRSAEEDLRKEKEDLEHRANELENILGQRVQVRAVVGDPAATTQETADEGEVPTLIAVGRRGLGAVRRLVMGSISTDVLRNTSHPVLIV